MTRRTSKGGALRAVRTIGAWRVVLVDSVTQVEASDLDAIVVTGSHGGLSSARFAAAVRARLYVFNDAGVGKGGAGVAGLDWLERRGIPAVAVSAPSARIGEAADTLKSGIVSARNGLAAASGWAVGDRLLERLEGSAPA